MHNALWVFVGGGTGALLRYGVSVLVNWVGWHNTISTLLVNILGSFLLGWISVSCTGSIRTNDTFRLLLAVGLCGGFTTFGTFSSDIVNLLRNGAWAQALAYAFLLCSIERCRLRLCFSSPIPITCVISWHAFLNQKRSSVSPNRCIRIRLISRGAC